MLKYIYKVNILCRLKIKKYVSMYIASEIISRKHSFTRANNIIFEYLII